jgi:hypothetical protein
MGKYNQGILGPFSGKIGSVVGSRWRDVNYMKSLPAGNNSNTEDQQKQRSKFKSTVSLASALMASLVKPVWNLAASSKLTGYNLFVKTNIGAFDENGDLTHADFTASVGDLSLPSNLVIANSVDVSSAIKLTWTDESSSGLGSETDTLRLLIIQNDKTFVMSTGMQRSAEMAELELPVDLGEVHVYAFFATEEEDDYSSDQYQLVDLS